MCPLPLIFQPTLANNACPINYVWKGDPIFLLAFVKISDF